MKRIALLALALAACHRSSDEGDQAPPAVVTAQTITVAAAPFTVTIPALGTVEPRPGTFVSLSAPAAARVKRVFVAPGDHVAAGDSLVEFERAPFDAEYHRAELARDAAQRAYDRAQHLAQDGILARKDVDQAANDLAQAQAAFVTAQRAAELAMLRAPIAGVVSRITAVAGASADPTQPLVDVVNPAALELSLTVSPAEAEGVHAGAPVVITSADRTPAESIGTGVVTAVAPTVDSLGRGVEVRARPTHTARLLRIGESVAARIGIAVHAGAIAVPLDALVPDGAAFKVFVVDSGGVAHARTVTVGARSGGLAEITDGLKPGETVVTTGAYGMVDGAKVTGQ
jgi:membrane fusion protein, multidrug efflux system